MHPRAISSWHQPSEGIMFVFPTGNALLVFVICLILGAFVIIKFCIDQFEQPSSASDENDPWKFVVPRFLTPRRQYRLGFSIYCGALILIFVGASILGPGPFFQ